MPELPELEVLRDYLGPRLDQRRVVKVWTSPKLGFLLRTPADEFSQRIRRHPGELKNLLRNQAFIAGVGNAYSDEILHEAGFLPLRKRSTLKPDDISRLHASTVKVMQSAVEAIRAQPHYIAHKQDRSFMAVHGKGGGACPRCGHRISELTARGENTNFCRGCQH